MKTLLKILILLFFICSCSQEQLEEFFENFDAPKINTGLTGCNSFLYSVYSYDACSCAESDGTCRTYYPITQELYICISDFLNESGESCVYTDVLPCSGITFSGYIKKVNVDCL